MELKHQDATSEKHAYKLGPQLKPYQKKEIHQIMGRYEDVLAVSFDEIKGAHTWYKHTIDTGDHKPVKQAPYQLAPHYKQWV